METKIKKKLRGIRVVKKKALGSQTLEGEVALDYSAALRSVLLEDGRPPLELPGIKVYEETEMIKKSLENYLDKKGDPTP